MSFPSVYTEIKKLNNLSNKYTLGSKHDMEALLIEDGTIVKKLIGCKKISHGGVWKSVHNPVLIKKSLDTFPPF